MTVHLPTDADWLQPPLEEEGLRRYLTTIREGLRLIVVATIVTTVIAIIYVLAATKMYTAESNLLITPINGTDSTLNSLGLLTASSDPTTDVETAAKLVTNVEVARLVKQDLSATESPEALLEKVSAVPIAQSNLIAVSATTDSPEGARELADAFARAAVQSRTNQMHEEIELILPGLERQLASNPQPETTAGSLSEQVAQLQTLQEASDPTIRVAVKASLPSSPSSPKTTLSIVAGVLAGLVLGVGAAFVAQVLDPRLRREEQLRRQYRLPILARIPKQQRRTRTAQLPIGPRSISPAGAEAYRTLRATLAAATPRDDEGRVVLVTGTASKEGKTTTAINLAAAFALAGKRVILIESDLRQPAVGRALGLSSRSGGILAVLSGDRGLSEALVSHETFAPTLRFLLADHDDGWIPELFAIPDAAEMIEEARRIADYVVIDSAPLTEVADALPLARLADDVLIVTRVGKSRLDRISQLSELLAESGIRPSGFIVVSTPRPLRSSYYTRNPSRGGTLASNRNLRVRS